VILHSQSGRGAGGEGRGSIILQHKRQVNIPLCPVDHLRELGRPTDHIRSRGGQERVTQRAYEECKEAAHGGGGAADVGLALTVGIAVFEYFHGTIAAGVADDIGGGKGSSVDDGGGDASVSVIHQVDTLIIKEDAVLGDGVTGGDAPFYLYPVQTVGSDEVARTDIVVLGGIVDFYPILSVA